MIDPISFLLTILLAVALSHLVRPRAPAVRLFWSCAPGAVLLLAAHPLALVFALLCLAFAAAVYAFGRRSGWPRLRARLPYAILLPLFAPDLFGVFAAAPILWLGSAFFLVRQMMTVAAALKNRRAPQDVAPALLLATFFLPAIPSGPVFSGLDLWDRFAERRPPDYGDGLHRLVEGFAHLFAFAGIAALGMEEARRLGEAFAAADRMAALWAMRVLVDPLLGFGFLFASFYGYSRMAEGAALLFGGEVPQNFDKPHLARDLADFWKRWHRSMAGFVMQHVYLPLLVSTGRPKLALVAAFGFMGIWHDFSAAFAVWGLGHGLALGYALPWAKRSGVPDPLIRVASLAYVVALSSIAHGVWT